MSFIDVRCQSCRKLLCRVSIDFMGVVELKCRHCKSEQKVSLAVILQQPDKDFVILPEKRASAQ